MKQLIVLLSMCNVVVAESPRVFMIGNSLSWDAYGGLLTLEGTWGAHIVSNAPLTRVLDTVPPEISRGATDWVAAGASGDWPVFSAQPFFHETCGEIVGQLNRLQAGVGSSEVVIFSTLPFRHQWNQWRSAPSGADVLFQPSEAAYECLEQMTGYRVIPAGHVAQRLVRKDVLEIDDLYRDHIHASGIGRLVYAHTIYAVLSDEYPSFSPYAKHIWAVLYPGDFDHDKDADGVDFLIWQADPSVGDFLEWQAAFSN